MEHKQASVDGILALAVVVLGMLLMMIGFNYKTIVLSCKGYSPSQINLIMGMESSSQAMILNEECLHHIDWWISLEKDASLYRNYEALLEKNPSMQPEEVKAAYECTKNS